MADNTILGQVLAQADSLADALAERNRLKQQADLAAQMQARREQAAKDMLDLQKSKLAEVAKQYPGRAVNVEGFSIGSDPRVQDAQLTQRIMQEKRLEAKALQDEFNRIAGPEREKLKAMEEAEGLMKDPSQIGYGQLTTLLARLHEKGALSEGDVQRAQPGSLKSFLARPVNWLAGKTVVDPYTDAQKREIADLIAKQKVASQQKARGAVQEISGRAPVLAPSLSQTGELKPTLQSLGIGMGTENLQPTPEQWSPESPLPPNASPEQKAARLQYLRSKRGQ